MSVQVELFTNDTALSTTTHFLF